MTAKILDGNKIAELERESITRSVNDLVRKGNRRPGLAVILVGADPASEVYVRNKRLACEQVGFYSDSYDFPADIKVEELLSTIQKLNKDPNIDGILVQLPLPSHIPSHIIMQSILPEKDVDGFHVENLGKLAQNQPGLRPCTPMGIMKMLSKTDLVLEGCNACVVGASRIVGRPMALELLNHNATVTICHVKTKDLTSHLKSANLVVVAIGQAQFIRGEWIKEGAVVIDVGINRLNDGKLVGDVHFEEASKRASWITPVPGGVGPMTIASLLRNTLDAANLHH